MRTTLACLSVLFLTLIPLSAQDAPREPIELTEEALKIHYRGILIDGHNDLPYAIRQSAAGSLDAFDLAQPISDFHTDIPRLLKGGVGAQFWSAYASAETAADGSSTRIFLEQIDLIRRIVARYPEHFELARTASDVRRIRRQGKIACMIGVEGGHAIQDSLGVLRMLHELGAGYMTLTHSDTLSWADSATDVPKHGGLTEFGESVVRTMNELGMLVDISHVSPATMRDALRVTQAPVIASHSSAKGIVPHPRNVPDEVLKEVAANGGVIMVNFFSGFIVEESGRQMAQMFNVRRKLREQHKDDDAFRAAMEAWYAEHPMESGTVHDIVDHIEHIVRVAGIDHVGLGSDYDGIGLVPKQMEDVSTYPYITQELLNRGYGEEEIHKILGENVLRVMAEAEDVARRLSTESESQR